MKNVVGFPLLGALFIFTLPSSAQEPEAPPEAEPEAPPEAEPEAPSANEPPPATPEPSPEASEPQAATFEPVEPAAAPEEPIAPVTPPASTTAPLAPRPAPAPAPAATETPATTAQTSEPPPPPSQDASPSSELPATSPPPPKSEEEDEGSGSGLYLDGNLIGTYGIKSTHQWNHTCPEVVVESDPSMNWNPTCSATTPIGVAMEGRLGFRIGALGIEGFGLGAVDWSSGKLGGEKPQVELPGFATDMQVGRVGGGFGGGLRLMSNGFFRVAAGLGGGIMFRHVFSNVSSLDGSSTGYTAPIIKGDLTITLGKFFNLGVLGWVEFSPQVEVTPNLSAGGSLAGIDPNDPNIPASQRAMFEAFEESLGDVTVFDGTQFFVGPYLGLHFGN